MSNYAQVREWHETFHMPILDKPDMPPLDRRHLRINLIKEEATEFHFAVDSEDLVEVADALADLLYVVYGAALEFGIPINTVFQEVHRSNMSKLDEEGNPIYREDGKVLKGPLYTPPNIKTILVNAGWEEEHG